VKKPVFCLKKKQLNFPGYHHFQVFRTITPYDFVPALAKRAVAEIKDEGT
jgi:hypothetical protein